MSISTMDSLDTVRALDAMNARQERIEAAERAFIECTRTAFADSYKGGMTMVEWLQYANGPRVRTQPTREAFYEELDYLGPQLALWKVLDESKCPLVAELKKAVEDSYIKRWASEIGEFRSES